MAGDQVFIKRVHGGVYGSRLDEDIVTLGVPFDHAANAADLPFDAVKAMDEFCFFFLTALGGFFFTAGAVGLFHILHALSCVLYTP